MRRPSTVVTERWYSPDLQIAVMTVHTDPMMGTVTTKLVNVTQGAPDASSVPGAFRLHCTIGKAWRPDVRSDEAVGSRRPELTRRIALSRDVAAAFHRVDNSSPRVDNRPGANRRTILPRSDNGLAPGNGMLRIRPTHLALGFLLLGSRFVRGARDEHRPSERAHRSWFGSRSRTNGQPVTGFESSFDNRLRRSCRRYVYG